MIRLLLLAIFFVVSSAVSIAQHNFYVAPQGSDTANGTKEKPFQSIYTALRAARNLRRIEPELNESIHIILREGIHKVTQSIVLRPEDGGSKSSTTYFEGENENSIISGGIQIQNWKRVSSTNLPFANLAKKNIYVADVPTVNGNDLWVRQLWIDDMKATRAKSSNGDNMHRILDWNKKTKSCLIPNLNFVGIENYQTEMFIHQWWEIANLRISKMVKETNGIRLFFHEPESTIQSEHPWPSPWLSKETGNSAFVLLNAPQFLDEPGEWYYDKQQRKLYYWPLTNQNMNTVNAFVPVVENIFELKGTDGNTVNEIVFQNLKFQHTAWNRPATHGHVPHQAGMYMTEAYKLRPSGTNEKPNLDNQAWIGRQEAAIKINFAKNIHIQDCVFQNMAATSIDMISGTQDCIIKGNAFVDIGGSAIVAGNFGEEGREIHFPLESESKQRLKNSVIIQNNFTTNTANEDWGCAAISIGLVSASYIWNNEIENTSYSGINIGWGWNYKNNISEYNIIESNSIHHFGKHNYDCAGIYVLGNQGSVNIRRNYIDSIYKAQYAHLPSHWFYLYADEGSKMVQFLANWTPSRKYLDNSPDGDNWFSPYNGTIVDDSIKKKAGLQIDYRKLKKYTTHKTVNKPISENHKELTEIVITDEKLFDYNLLKQIMFKSNMDTTAIYKWNNHIVLYDFVTDIAVLHGRLKSKLKGVDVRAYHDMYYQYAKWKHCTDTTVAKEWTDILLTANLVDDTAKQNLYYKYHEEQFVKWPEVAKGFCNADFQELAMFRNGRQLMLIISIPKGKTLDELNPKTTQNNLRMNDWNKIMAPFQTGIQGTKKGESWVFLKKISER